MSIWCVQENIRTYLHVHKYVHICMYLHTYTYIHTILYKSVIGIYVCAYIPVKFMYQHCIEH